MHAPSPHQQPETRPRTAGGFVRALFRKLRQALRPTNPFRTATGVAVTGSPPPQQAAVSIAAVPTGAVPTAAAPGAGPTRQTPVGQAEITDGKSF